MSAVECLAWSALVVSAVAVVVWLLGWLAKWLGVAVGFAPAWAVLTSIPLVTAASLLPSSPAIEAQNQIDSVVQASRDSAIPTPNGVANLLNGRPVLSEEEARRPIRPDDRTPAAINAATAPFVDWSALKERAEPAFRAAAPWLVGVMLLGLAAGWLRLAIGWRAISRLARLGRPVQDAELRELVDVLRAELSLTRPIELRECPALPSPAAVGWRRAAVLLPTTWREWSEDERRAVLAHELAHVKRGDYFAWVVAQACAAAHYFNPLVRGVAQWLRLEQERSADADAARLAGGRREYLRVLATLAVRQRDVSAAWPARCFLPTRGSFVRRIEMLRSRPPRWSVRTAAGHAISVAAVAAIGLGLTSFRPALAALAPNTPSNTATAADASPIPIPQTAIAAGQIRVAEGMKHPQFGKFVAEFVKSAPPLSGKLGIKIDEVDRIGIVVLATDQVPDFDGAIVITGKAPWDLKKIVADQPQVTLDAGAGPTVIREGDQVVGMLVDPKTLVFADKPRIGDKVVRAMTGPRHEALERVLGKAADSSMSFATSGTEFFGAIVSRPNRPDDPAAMFVKPILEGQQGVLLKVDAGADLAASIEADYSSPEGAKNASKIVEAGLTILGNLVKTAGASAPKEAAPMLNAAKAALASAQVQAEGSKATVKMKVAGGELLAALGSAMASAQESSSRMVGANNMKQIALAMHNYSAVFNKFPAAAAPEGQSQHPVSWRVRILPYIEQEALYREYRMDEPWDGPNNKKLLEKMPNIYKSPVKPSATETPYQVLAGERTIFPPGRGIGFAEIVDGTSNTILVVETSKMVPWTKPDDIPFPLTGKPSWGGLHKGGFNVAMADGSVQFMSESVDLNVLVGLCTRDGGEVIGADSLRARPTPPRRP